MGNLRVRYQVDLVAVVIDPTTEIDIEENLIEIWINDIRVERRAAEHEAGSRRLFYLEDAGYIEIVIMIGLVIAQTEKVFVDESPRHCSEKTPHRRHEPAMIILRRTIGIIQARSRSARLRMRIHKRDEYDNAPSHRSASVSNVMRYAPRERFRARFSAEYPMCVLHCMNVHRASCLYFSSTSANPPSVDASSIRMTSNATSPAVDMRDSSAPFIRSEEL